MTVDTVPADPHAFTFDDWTARARDLRPHARAVIDGRSVPSASGKTYPDITGRDSTTIADVAEGGEEDVDRAVGAARAAFDDGRWSDLEPVDRKKLLLRFAELMRGDLEYLALVEALDCGKPIRDTLRVD
ncbi:MAG: 4-(gamma-glutamylamino)butanal dehydrogenase, partial [Chloroflexota bacterium]|nr:4-(gamma-glutamylamino)butanal dehydrogenase [Chloroflexota bacterium]